jgi:hypothetical protein
VKNVFEEGLAHSFRFSLLRQNNFLKRAILTCDSRISRSGWLHHLGGPLAIAGD